MPNYNLMLTTTCPHCLKSREARGDVVRKAARENRQLYCKPCRNKLRFSEKSHPTKGTGVKNSPEMLGAYKSYTRAKRRSSQGSKHHAAYEAVEFKFESFEEFYALLGPRPEGHTIDRINPLGHYEPDNVRWATRQQQVDNRLPRNYWVNRQS
jgi:hypothetical protein